MKPFVLLRRSLICCMLPAVLLAGCTPGSSGGDAFRPKLDPAYSVQAALTYGENQSAELTLTRCGAGDWDAEFSQPETLSGVVLAFDGGAVTASYKGLAFTIPKSALPAKAMLVTLTDVLDAVQASEELACTAQSDGNRTVSGETEAGSYSLSFAPDGTLLAFEIPSQPLTVAFSGYQPAQTAVTTVSETTAVTTETTASAETTVST